MIKKYFLITSRRFAVLGGFLLAAALCCGCREQLPTDVIEEPAPPVIFPDYSEVTVPVNIAPLNFEIEEEGTEFLTEITGGNGERHLAAGKTVEIPMKFWKKLLAANQEGEIFFTVFAKRDGAWRRFAPIRNSVSSDKIDPWLTYRKIEPGYDRYGNIQMEERCLEDFRTKRFFDNTSLVLEEQLGKSCANCHHCRANDPNNSLFHVRHRWGGTMLRINGKLKKIDTVSRSGFAMSYPSWHPTLPLIAYSSNNTRQIYHSFDLKKIEVLDDFSDLMLYDIERKQIIPVFESDDVYETFPAWRPDGLELYYCVAKLKTSENRVGVSRKDAAEARLEEMGGRTEEIRYSMMKMGFDPQTLRFGEPEVVFDANATSASYVHPRFSPDGRYMIYIKLRYGTFPLTHRESDLWLLDLATGETRPMSEANSDNAESFHSFSSSGRWMVFSSRRGDGQFTRTYFTHFSADGACTKAFLLPTKSPGAERADRFSQNLPEMMTGPLPQTGGEMSRKIRFLTAEKSAVRDG